MPTNWYIFLLTALIPLAIGAIYYNPRVMGNVWMKANGFSDKDLEGANMPVIFLVSFILSAMFSFFLSSLVIHQGAVFSLLVPEVLESGSAAQNTFNSFMAEYGERYRSFGHGAAHGVMSALFFVLPLIAINAMFERRGWKYIMIHFGYWLICLILMGGIICSTLKYSALT